MDLGAVEAARKIQPGKVKLKWAIYPIREWFSGAQLRKRREFTKFGPKTTMIIGPLYLAIYWDYRAK